MVALLALGLWGLPGAMGQAAPQAEPATTTQPTAAGSTPLAALLDPAEPGRAALREWPHVAVTGIEMPADTDARDAWLATAIEETLAWRLMRVRGVLVIPTVRVAQARRELRENAEKVPSDAVVIGGLGGRWIIRGRCRGNLDAVALELEQVDLQSASRVVAQESFPAGRLFDVLDAATRWIAERFELRPTPAEEKLIFAPPARSPSAVEYYARAVQAAREDDLEDAAYYARRSLEYDGLYRSSLAMLAQLELRAGAVGLNSAERRLRMLTDLSRMARDEQDWAAAELGLGIVLQIAGAFAPAYERMEAALATWHANDAVYGEIAATNSLCDLYLTRRPPPGVQLSQDEVRRFAEQNLRYAAAWQRVSIGLLEALDDVLAKAPAANKLALVYERLGAQEEALAMHRLTLEAAQRIGARRTEAAAWLAIGQWYQRQGRHAEALEATQRCAAIAPEGMLPAAKLALAGIHLAQEQLAEALREFEQAYERLQAGEDLQNQLVCARQIAELRRKLGRPDEALRALREAIDIATALQSEEAEGLRAKLKEWEGERP